MRLSLSVFASIATVAVAVVAAPSVHAQEAAATSADPAMQSGTMQSGMMGGSYSRSMMVSKNDTTGANSIAAIAMSDPQFSTLVRLVKASGLDNSLMYRGPLTVFAPTNEAFDKLPGGTVQFLMMPENIKYLQAILQYHIVPGGYTASDVTAMNGQNVRTASRMNPLTIGAGPSLSYGGMSNASMNSGSTNSGAMNAGGMMGTSRITRPDIMASNGVIHVIDTVLLPPMDEMTRRDMMMSMRAMRGRNKMNRGFMDKSLVREATEAQKSTPEQLKDKPLGGSPTETPKAEAPKTEESKTP